MRYTVKDRDGHFRLGTIEVPDWKDETLRAAIRKFGWTVTMNPNRFSFRGEPECLYAFDGENKILVLILLTCPICGSFEGCDQGCPQRSLN